MAGGGQGWILVVEDEPGQLTLCLDRLGALGYCAYGAANAEEALPLVRAVRFAAILLDDTLPGMTGPGTIGELTRWSDVPVLLMTSHHHPDLETDALLLGAKGYLRKPLDFARLHQDLRRIQGHNT